MGKITVMEHPLIQHKIGWIRRTSTGSRDFRSIVSEIAMLMCYEATRELELADIEIETPICKAVVKELKGKKLAVVPILRAGLGMVEGMLTCGLKHWITFFLRPSIPFSYSTDVPMLIYERGVNGQANTSYGFLSLEAKISGRSLTISGYKINQSNNNAYSSNSPASRCYFALGAVHEIVIQK